MERNQELERLADIFVGDWALSITNQWWLDDPTDITSGTATGEWLGSSFIRLPGRRGARRTDGSRSLPRLEPGR